MSGPGPDIPDRLYYKIGEVAKLTGVKPYVLRYWESEFRLVRPQKSRAGQRLYQRRDIEVLLQIRRLLYDEKYTIPGAKKQLRLLRGPADRQQLALEFDAEGALTLGAMTEAEARDEGGDDAGPSAGPGGRGHEGHDEAADDFDSMDASLDDPTAVHDDLDDYDEELSLEDPTSAALVDQAIREAEAILALVEGVGPVG